MAYILIIHYSLYYAILYDTELTHAILNNNNVSYKWSYNTIELFVCPCMI